MSNLHRCECSICTFRGDEIERVRESKRAALKLADERAKEANELRQALQCLVNMYVDLIKSGDCGNWDPECDKEVIAARMALDKL